MLTKVLNTQFNRLFFISSILLLNGCSPPTENHDVVGFLEWDRVELINESSEPIVQRAVQEGQSVQAGDLILALDDRRATATLNKALANRNQLAARLQELEHGNRVEDIEQARQTQVQAQSRVKLAQLELDRIIKIQHKDLISQETLDKARAEAQTAQALLESAQANLQKLISGTREEQIQQASNALQAADAEVNLVQITQQRLQIRAPVAGRVDSLPFQVGEQPQTGSVVAVLLVGTQPYAKVHIPEPMRAKIKPGTTAKVKVDGVTERLDAKVRWIADSPDFTPYYALTQADRSRLSYAAKLDLIQPNYEPLPAGVPLTVTFDLEP